jgi:hypothetical protein
VSETRQDSFTLRHPAIAAVILGFLLALVGTWPMLAVVVPDSLDLVAKICTLLAFPGIYVALAVGEGVHTYSRAVVFVGDLLFYSVLAAPFLWWRQRRAS